MGSAGAIQTSTALITQIHPSPVSGPVPIAEHSHGTILFHHAINQQIGFHHKKTAFRTVLDLDSLIGIAAQSFCVVKQKLTKALCALRIITGNIAADMFNIPQGPPAQ